MNDDKIQHWTTGRITEKLYAYKTHRHETNNDN